MMDEANPPKAAKERLMRKTEEARLLGENARKTQEVAEGLFPGEKFVSDMAEAQPRNKYAKGLCVPQNVKVAESRIPVNSDQRDVLRKELKQAEILAKMGSSVYLTPERSGYKVSVADAIVNGVPFEFRNVTETAKRVEKRFGSAKEKGDGMNVFLRLDTDVTIDEARRRIGLVLGRHPKYTGRIIVSTKEGEVYFWDTASFR